MAGNIPRGLEWAFLIHFFVGAFLGVALLIFQEAILGGVGWPSHDDVTPRLLGAALIAISTSSLLAWREKELEKVKIVVEMELVWLAVGLVVSIYGVIFIAINWLAFVVLAMFGVFFAAFAYFYRKAY
ncbi:MAG: hypothetical protein RBG13Loki_0120 [Promethearchaeota archaeon CR_4]|nr:MAG: hypothetical protein RBG13Loki_0120 [Candidatus Lokiarchaeota archaeon CR_4]